VSRLRSTDLSDIDQALRALGFGCAVAAGASVIGAFVSLILESDALIKWSLSVLLVSIIVPYIAMRWHLWATGSLTHGEKRTWRHVAGWGGFGFIASFFYLMRSDRRLRP
jgi:hypothetical protein